MNSQDQGEKVFLTPKENGRSSTNKKGLKADCKYSIKPSGKDKEQNQNMTKVLKKALCIVLPVQFSVQYNCWIFLKYHENKYKI